MQLLLSAKRSLPALTLKSAQRARLEGSRAAPDSQPILRHALASRVLLRMRPRQVEQVLQRARAYSVPARPACFTTLPQRSCSFAMNFGNSASGGLTTGTTPT